MLAEGGQNVALIEREHLGGTCTNVGCTPSKTHIAAAKRAHDARTANELGLKIGAVEVDLPAIVARTQSIVHFFRADIEKRLQNTPNLHLFHGQGRFVGPNQLEIAYPSGQRTIFAQNVVVATGARAVVPPIEGLKSVAFLTHRTIFELKTVPSHLTIVGGGYIACELAQCFRRLGARVTLVQKGEQILDDEDADVSQEIAQILRGEGVEILLGCETRGVRRWGDGIEIQLEKKSLRASHLLVAVGQKPETHGLGLEHLNAKIGEKSEIQVNEFLEAAPNVWALGDCKGGPQFTHIAFDDARILAARLLDKRRVSVKNRPVPWVVFTDPQLGRIGLSEKAAREQKIAFRVAKLPVCDTARGLESGEDKGFLKVLVSDDDQIVGGAFLARDGGELIATLQVAMMGKMPFQTLRDAIFAHPTQTESLNRVLNLK